MSFICCCLLVHKMGEDSNTTISGPIIPFKCCFAYDDPTLDTGLVAL